MKIKGIRKVIITLLSIFFVISMIIVGITTEEVKATGQSVSNPRVSDTDVTWDCIYFGNYYQTIEGAKEPIKWRVLSVDENNNAFIITDKILDCRKYNETTGDIKWKNSTLRSWLNGYDANSNADGIDYSTDNFIDTAFTEAEQSAINTT